MAIDTLIYFARGGGGGSGGGGGGSGSGGGGGTGLIYLPIVVGVLIYTWWKRKQQLKRAQTDVLAAEAKDAAWSEDAILGRAKDIFYKYQNDWSNFNYPSMQTYLSPRYYAHISLMLRVLQQMGRQNLVDKPNLLHLNLFKVADSLDNQNDSFDVEVKGRADDQLIDVSTKKVLFRDKSGFVEIWHFDRQGDSWLLDDIAQQEAESSIEGGWINKNVLDDKDSSVGSGKMTEFALRNNFFYNADFGWLLLPLKGVLFSAASFGHSDINFHVLGIYRNVIVQFYQYVPFPNGRRSFSSFFTAFYRPYYRVTNYTIAQAILPKTYGDILVQHHSLPGFRFTPRGMRKVSTEWGDFNKKYNVFATDIEQATSFELLNPTYMEKLEALPFKVNLEVVDNVLYLYSTDENASYDQMLQVLQLAFEQMKM